MGSLICTQTDYMDQVFEGVRLEHVELVSSEFHNCTFIRCSFTESVFRNCRFVNSVFRHCDLSLIQVPNSSFSGCRFEDSKIIGVNWTAAHWPATRLRDPIRFSKCAISHSTFIGLSLKGIHVRDCVAQDVDFREANLFQADFGGSDLAKSMFGNTDLTEADLSTARNYWIDPGQNVLKKTKFSLPEAMSLLHSLDIVLVEEES